MLSSDSSVQENRGSQAVGGAAALAVKEPTATTATVGRASQQPRLTAWDYVQIDRLLRARRRAARR